MTTSPTGTRAAARPTRQPVPWLSVALLSAVLAYADGFVLTSLQAAIGTVDRTNGLFMTWLRRGTLLLPLFVLAVLWALRRAHRRYGNPLPTSRAVAVASLLTVVAGTAVGVGAVAVSSASSYGVQAHELETTQAIHFHVAGSTPSQRPGECGGICRAERSTLAVHVRGVGYAGGVLLGMNLVLVAWVVAARGGRLEVARRAAVAETPTSHA